MKFCIALVFAIASLCYGVEIPGFVPVSTTLLAGSRLTLREVDASIMAPGAEYTWLVKPGTPVAYVAVNEKTDERIMVQVHPNARISGHESEFISGALKGGRKSATNNNRTVLHDSAERLECPPHGNLYGYSQSIQLPNNVLNTIAFVIPSAENLVMVVSYPADGKPSSDFLQVLKSVHYNGAQALPANFSSVAAKNSDKDLSPFMVLGYLFMGGLIVQFTGWIFGKKDVNGASVAVIVVLAIMVLRIALIVMNAGTNAHDNGYRIGQEVGTAIFPLLILGYMSQRKAKETARQKTNSA